MTINWGAAFPWLMVSAGAWLAFGPVAAGGVLIAAGLLHFWGAFRSERSK